MTITDLQTLVYHQLGIAQSTANDNLIVALVDDVIVDIMIEAELDLEVVNDPAFATVASQAYVLAPAGFVKSIKIWKTDKELKKLNSPEEYWILRRQRSAEGEPDFYYPMGRDSSGRRQIFLEPVPNAIYTYNLAYYAVPQGLDLTKVPDEWDLVIVAGVKKYLIEAKAELLPLWSMVNNEYDRKLKKLLGLEQRLGDEGKRARIDPAIVIKNRYVLRRGRKGSFRYPFN